MTQRIQEAIDILLDSLNNGTLAKGECTACAVGNLVAKGQDGKVIKERQIWDNNSWAFGCTTHNAYWGSAFMTKNKKQKINKLFFDAEEVLENVNATNFTLEELMKIEYAFETNTKIHSSRYHKTSKAAVRQDQINGLNAVIQVMLGFDNIKESVREVFTNKAELILI